MKVFIIKILLIQWYFVACIGYIILDPHAWVSDAMHVAVCDEPPAAKNLF